MLGKWRQINVIQAWASDFHGTNIKHVLDGRCKAKNILYEEGILASSFCGYKDSVVKWFTTKSKVMLQHTLKELRKVTERQNMALGRKTHFVFHMLSAGHG